MVKSKPDESRVWWMNRGWQPLFIGFCPSPQAWFAQMKKEDYSATAPPPPYPTTSGWVRRFGAAADGAYRAKADPFVLIGFNKVDFFKATPVQRIGLAVHECVHVWQFVLAHTGQDKLDFMAQELEAYSIQSITQDLLAAIKQSWGPDALNKPAGEKPDAAAIS